MSAALGALIAHVAFWVLLVYGWFWDELGLRGVGVFLVLWIAGFLGAGWIPHGDSMFFSYVALLDVALVLIVFKGDLPVT